MKERCTEVAVRDDSAEGMLRKFVATKRVEGIADSTLKRYAEINLALVDFLYPIGCRVSEVAAMHLRQYLDSREDTCGALFAGRGSRRLTKNGIEAIVKRFGKAAGVEMPALPDTAAPLQLTSLTTG